MGRPREFDEAEVVASARTAFWCGGVEATSVSDLSAATGLSTGSLYKAFGSKAGLASLTLQDYLDRGLETIRDMVEDAPSGLVALRRWLEWSVQNATSGTPARGCYAVVCAIELAARDDDVRARLRRHDRRLQALVADAVHRAVSEGDLRPDVDAGAAARFLCTAVNGLQVEARKGVSAAHARATLDLAVRALT